MRIRSVRTPPSQPARFPGSLHARLLAALFLAAAAGSHAGSVSEQLHGEPSAFLRANSGSPVDWMKWGEAAF